MNKIAAFISISLITFCSLNNALAHKRPTLRSANNSRQNKYIVENAYKNVFESFNYDEQIIKNYFAEDYVQTIDGKTMRLSELMAYIKSFKDNKSLVTIEFLTMISGGDKIFFNHLMHVTDKEGKETVVKVMAEYEVKDGLIHSSDQLTRFLTGNKKEVTPKS